jgi:NADP-dependent 3-hydroxy acid dehydrogenase YdfG
MLTRGRPYSGGQAWVVVASEASTAEWRQRIRPVALLPGEVAKRPSSTNRPVPEFSAADKERMLQSEGLRETILYVPRMPASVCVNEYLDQPTEPPLRRAVGG